MINGKIHKTLGVTNLAESKDWDLVRGKLKRINVNLIDSEYPGNASHFNFGFVTKTFCHSKT